MGGRLAWRNLDDERRPTASGLLYSTHPHFIPVVPGLLAKASHATDATKSAVRENKKGDDVDPEESVVAK